MVAESQTRDNGLVFTLKWVMANVIAWLAGFALGWASNSPFIFALSLGVAMSAAQSGALGNVITSETWYLATTPGWALGLAVTYLLPWRFTTPYEYVVLGAVGGFASAVLQYAIQWRRSYPRYRWLAAVAVSGLIGGCVGGLALGLIDDAAPVTLEALTSGTSAFYTAMGLAAAGLCYALITALPLLRLRQPNPRMQATVYQVSY